MPIVFALMPLEFSDESKNFNINHINVLQMFYFGFTFTHL